MDSILSGLAASSLTSPQNQSYFCESSSIICLCKILSLKFDKNDKWHITSLNKNKYGPNHDWDPLSTLEFVNQSCKFIVSEEICIDSKQANMATMMIPRLFQPSIEKLTLRGQTLTLNEFKFLCKNVEYCYLSEVSIRNESNECSLKTALQEMPFLYHCEYKFNDLKPSSYPEDYENYDSAAEDLVRYLRYVDEVLKSRIQMVLTNVPESFDIWALLGYLKISPADAADVKLEFSKTISKDYKELLENVVKETLRFHFWDYCPPLITFEGIDDSDVSKMKDNRRMHFQTNS